jgi:site-specific recombinase XerD
MLEDLFRRPRVQRRIRQNPHGLVLEQFAEYLSARGHSLNTVHPYVFAAEHFCRWLGGRKITRHAVHRFINQHLSSCHCKTPSSGKSASVCAALNRLLEMVGADAVAPARKSPADSLLRRYAAHLKQVQGLAAATVHYRLRYARTMLSHFRFQCLGQLKQWTVKQIRQFVVSQSRGCRPSSGQVIASSIRSFLRFLLLHQLINRDLAAAVPAFANWRLASLPPTVSGEELERLVRAINPTSPVGLRDRAIVLCLVESGLRASDVAGLDLDGLDLTARALRLSRRKQRDFTAVPISRRLAAAIGAYVRRGRPACSTSCLFVSHRAPRGKAMTPIGVRGVVVRRAAEAGLADCIRGTHVIRHSVASRWIQAGATLKQIADLLGHRSIDTTSIYAKVDLRALTQVALPWPSDREVTP